MNLDKNNHEIYSDPTCKFFWLVEPAIIANGIIGSGINMNAANESGWSSSSSQFWLSGLLGFVTGGLQTAAGIFGGYSGMILGSALGSFINNVGNQSIFSGNVNWNEAGQAFGGGFIAGIVSAGIFYGVDKYIMPVMNSPIGSSLGSPLMYPNVANWWSLFAGNASSYFSAPTGVSECQAFDGGGACNYQIPQGAH